MRKALKSRVEFIFMDAPHEAKGEEAEIRAAGGTGDHPRTWWHWEVHCLHAIETELLLHRNIELSLRAALAPQRVEERFSSQPWLWSTSAFAGWQEHQHDVGLYIV